jgi:arsenate reductase (thioredoxin)
MKKVLFVCIHNSGRSQMAQAFAERLGKGVIEAESAGTQPADGINPIVRQAMAEIGYDMADQHPKIMTFDIMTSADRVVTMGCEVAAGATCPATFAPTEDWGLEDPKNQPIEKVREIRDEIKRRIEQLIAERKQ